MEGKLLQKRRCLARDGRHNGVGDSRRQRLGGARTFHNDEHQQRQRRQCARGHTEIDDILQ